MQDLGRLLFFVGLGLVLVGGFLWIVSSAGWLRGLGRLPGDLFIQRGNTTFSFPIVTCLLISALVSLLLWFFRR